MTTHIVKTDFKTGFEMRSVFSYNQFFKSVVKSNNILSVTFTSRIYATRVINLKITLNYA